MTTLAQRLVETRVGIYPVLDAARQHLECPFESNHSHPPHAALAAAYAADAMGTAAARFVFDGPLCRSAHTMIRDMDTLDIVERTARLPAPIVWLEWRFEGYEAGALIEDIQDQGLWKVSIFLAAPAATAAVSVLPLLVTHYFVGGNGGTVDTSGSFDPSYVTDRHAAHMIRMVLCLLAILNVPRAATTKQVIFRDGLQKKRRRHGKLPLLSFNQVTIRYPRQDLRHSGTARYKDGPGVRRHRVIGHFRIGRNGDAAPVFIWVTSYERGDARLGVVMREVHAVQ